MHSIYTCQYGMYILLQIQLTFHNPKLYFLYERDKIVHSTHKGNEQLESSFRAYHHFDFMRHQ